jgi:hypothetical protein
MLDGEHELFATPAQVEVGIAPGVKLGATAQGLPVAEASGALTGVMDQGHGEGEATLEVAQVGEQLVAHGQQRAHVAGGVLAERLLELVGGELGIAGGPQPVLEASEQVGRGRGLDEQPRAHPGAEGEQVFAAEALWEPTVAGRPLKGPRACGGFVFLVLYD